MSIVRDNDDERQAQVDRMIAEFRRAQWRRRPSAATVIGDDRVVELPRDVRAQATTVGSTPTRFPVDRE